MYFRGRATKIVYQIIIMCHIVRKYAYVQVRMYVGGSTYIRYLTYIVVRYIRLHGWTDGECNIKITQNNDNQTPKKRGKKKCSTYTVYVVSNVLVTLL